MAVVNTFSPDEQVEEVLEAAASLPDVEFYITGDPIRAKKTFLRNHTENVKFTGFLPNEEYLGLLRAVQAVMVLVGTVVSLPHCVPSGALDSFQSCV